MQGQSDAHPRGHSSSRDDPGHLEVARVADTRTSNLPGATDVTGLVGGRSFREPLPGQPHQPPGRLTARARAARPRAPATRSAFEIRADW